ncbi:hypothetical protein ACP70R_006646 [Stipagrostis hirtigluma subsp. patula]
MAPGRHRRRAKCTYSMYPPHVLFAGKGRSASRRPTRTVHDVPDPHLPPAGLHHLSRARRGRVQAVVPRRGGRRIRFRRSLDLVAGHYHTVDPDYDDDYGDPVFVPLPTLTTDGSRFSLDFLPDRYICDLVDSRGSLLLVRLTGSVHFPNLVVCEPLTRRYQPILPERLRSKRYLGFFLLDGDKVVVGTSGAGSISMSNFRVLAALHSCRSPASCVFTSGSDGGWRLGHGGESTHGDISLPNYDSKAAPCLSLTRPPYDVWTIAVTGGDDGALRVVRVINDELKVFVRLQGGGEWFAEKSLRLPEATDDGEYFEDGAVIITANERYILLTPREETWLFSVELKTMEVEREHERNRVVDRPPYLVGARRSSLSRGKSLGG